MRQPTCEDRQMVARFRPSGRGGIGMRTHSTSAPSPQAITALTVAPNSPSSSTQRRTSRSFTPKAPS